MHVLLHIGELRGEPQFEPVHVEELHGGGLKLLNSPGLAYEVAAGDTIEVDESGNYEVLHRAGNVAVRVYFNEPIGVRLKELEQEFAAMGGSLDGQVEKGAVFTVAADGQLSKVQLVMRNFAAANKDCVWEFGNVFDARGAPLEWCNQLLDADEA